MADRSEVLQSAAYAALSLGGKRVLHVIEEEVAAHGNGVVIPLDEFMARGMCRTAAQFGIRQCECLGLIKVEIGPRRVNVFRLCDDWRALDKVEAKRLVRLARGPTPQRASSKPVVVKPVKVVKPPKQVTVEPPREDLPRVPSMPKLAFLQDDRWRG